MHSKRLPVERMAGPSPGTAIWLVSVAGDMGYDDAGMTLGLLVADSIEYSIR